ncbi:hypothetical protein RhiirC2_798986 [Rhizophagus irregularis]|uniref:Uncharacterized protein n=1 Tax=Rhizophagus irregularis TaxID=588596 RepID=A0A2N1M5S4_9GLOM|nr:hypothetical protein RhiirC2_798986 [Rhizophagus irregularis]
MKDKKYKTYSKIDLDRIRIVTDTQEEILLNTKEEVQAEAINAFSSLFHMRNYKFETYRLICLLCIKKNY